MRLLRVVLVIILLQAVVGGSALAYRLICIPTAETLPDGVYKLEVSAPYNHTLTDEWLPAYRFDGTVTKGFEISIKGGTSPGNWRASNTQVSLAWTVARETEDKPGYGIGILNWYDSEDHEAPPGKRAVKESVYAGIYKTVDIGLKFPAKLHLLVGTKCLNGVFGGFALPLSKRFSIAAEYVPEATSDAKSLMTPGNEDEHLVVGVGYNHNQHWRFKYASIGGDSAWGVVYTSNWVEK
jgi:hypothetical protein